MEVEITTAIDFIFCRIILSAATTIQDNGNRNLKFYTFMNGVIMTGSEFRAIRRFNKYSQRTISEKTGMYMSDSAVKEMERGSKAPHFFVRILSSLIGLDLSKEDNLRKVLDGIPEKLFHAKISTRKPKPKPAVVFRPTGNIFLN
ncbi:MAG: hypothetical protein M9949_10780 [Candidatus Kapabacteria bacterium]|nr:hypothetical protein [Candidatus Kapabacteria bacterium]